MTPDELRALGLEHTANVVEQETADTMGWGASPGEFNKAIHELLARIEELTLYVDVATDNQALFAMEAKDAIAECRHEKQRADEAEADAEYHRGQAKLWNTALQDALAQVDALKCCGNCEHYTRVPLTANYYCNEDEREPKRGHSMCPWSDCWFTPSRWQARS